ncbi:MAG: amidase family protein, partial [Firmicutes bacterium]|nr:amidase family protein [Bacillota bacterium]
AVAADMCAVALGTDCGGGVRLPAHFCGVVGIKPSYGRISRYGIVPLVSSMDQAGLLAKSIEDAAMALEIIAGPDGKDVTLTPQEIGAYRQACTKPVKGLKVGLPREFLNEITAPPTMKMIEKAAAALCQAGAQVEEVDLPHTKYALSVYYILASAEASSNLARYDGVSFGLRVERNNVYDMISATRTAGFGGKAKLRILLGAYVTSAQQIEAYYQQALRIRTLIKNDYETVFAAGYDCLLTPVSMNTAFKLGEYSNDPLAMYITDFYTAPANLVGLPAMTVPYAMEEGLPMGLQLLAKPFDEETLFMVGSALEQPRFIPPDVAKQARQKGAV